MALHILRVARHCSDIAELKEAQRERKAERGFYCFYTRNMPKRSDEVLDGGSVYWVINGYIQARQRIKGFMPIVNRRGRPAVLVKVEAKITPTAGQPLRSFRGWRYATEKEVPKDQPKAKGGEEIPPAMARELRELGLL